MKFFKLYLVSLISFFAIDMVWLGLVARSFYQRQIGFLMTSDPKWSAALIFYLLFVAGLLVFVIVPGLNANSLKATIIKATVFGLITYATYDLTNLATLKDWPILVSIVDLLWGSFLSVSVSYIGFLIGRKFNLFSNSKSIFS